MQNSIKKPLLLIIDEHQKYYFQDEFANDIILKPVDINSSTFSEFISDVEKYTSKFSPKLKKSLFSEPERLLNKGEYRAAVISVMTLLESLLASKLQNFDISPYSMPFTKMITIAQKHEILKLDNEKKLKEMYQLRNRLVHGKGNVTKKRSVDVVQNIMKLISSSNLF